MKLVVTIPAQNEEKTIAAVVGTVPRDIPGVDEVEVIVVNDGSTDRTAEFAREAGAHVVDVVGRPGLGRIFRTGMERALRRGADVVCNIDGDGQFNSDDIRHLIEPIRHDQADFVTCSRFARAEFKPVMPTVKYYGNKAVTKIINWICGGTEFTDVSCGFRAFNREAACRLTLFGRYTYTQECFIDLFAKGMRIVEVPLKVRGVREHGKSRVASSIFKYATNSFPIIMRAMRDIQPLKFFGGIAIALFIPGLLSMAAVAGWYLYTLAFLPKPKTDPITSLLTLGSVLVTLSFLMGVLALLADMLGRQRKISDEMLYLARRRIYSTRRTVRVHLPHEHTPAKLSASIAEQLANGPTLHDSWQLPVIRSVPETVAALPSRIGAR